ncbi:hypothetical protein H9I32_07060 [Bacillus sp. Xin]|uniref:AbiJ-related protein n=1 Tax=unclassified Bacillus (in: firmicutes) TaxID=185979 RepID=UPI001573D39F|nr:MULTISPECIES: hypothetical protein [unclassified Bacillus (in: firmicutes)]MBC6972182.1 hypothetical protein [Bacillus sp. Xin]NSW36886.1 hypothetical protein [Bacillus sp. Xin1]
MNNSVSILTRRNLLDALLRLGDFTGRFELINFLELIWPLDDMPSTDSRFSSARRDIWQHMVNNSDWDENFLYWDYLDINNSSDDVLFTFLEQIVHPAVRENRQDQQTYVEVINAHLDGDGFQLQVIGEMSGYPLYKVLRIRGGVQGDVKNLIFATDGPKPEIVITDSVNNDIQITRNREYCLVYDRPISSNGLLWRELIQWWRETQGFTGTDIEVGRHLYQRLLNSLSSPAEIVFFRTYFEKMLPVLHDNLPALVPQVYLHYDPYTLRELNGERRLPRQRMDFLLLLHNRERVVIEIDGKHHYADGDRADVNKYADMVSADRELKLRGYEVFRFGGVELMTHQAVNTCEDFFQSLLTKYQIID